MIPASGAGGPGFDSRIGPQCFCIILNPFALFLVQYLPRFNAVPNNICPVLTQSFHDGTNVSVHPTVHSHNDAMIFSSHSMDMVDSEKNS